jgi:hypothetical protein
MPTRVVRGLPATVVVACVIVVPRMIVMPGMVVMPGVSTVPRPMRGGHIMVAMAAVMAGIGRPPDPALVELDATVADRARAGRIGILITVRVAVPFVGRARADQGETGDGSK